MADTYRRGARLVLVALARIIVRMHDLPSRGVHVGMGIHTPMPDTFIVGGSNPGWTRLPYRMARRLHPTNDDWGCLIADETKVLFADPQLRDARLTPTQQTALTNAIAASLALDATWAAGVEDEGDPTN